MSISVEIVAIDQRMDLTTNKITNSLVMRLVTGEHISVNVGVDVVSKLAALQPDIAVEDTSSGLPTPPMPETSAQYVAAPLPSFSSDGTTDTTTSVFGGDDVAPTPPPQAAAPAADVRRRPTVTKNEFGYPVVHGAQGVDPGELAGKSGEQDEDGVGSI